MTPSLPLTLVARASFLSRKQKHAFRALSRARPQEAKQAKLRHSPSHLSLSAQCVALWPGAALLLGLRRRRRRHCRWQARADDAPLLLPPLLLPPLSRPARSHALPPLRHAFPSSPCITVSLRGDTSLDAVSGSPGQRPRAATVRKNSDFQRERERESGGARLDCPKNETRRRRRGQTHSKAAPFWSRCGLFCPISPALDGSESKDPPETESAPKRGPEAREIGAKSKKRLFDYFFPFRSFFSSDAPTENNSLTFSSPSFFSLSLSLSLSLSQTCSPSLSSVPTPPTDNNKNNNNNDDDDNKQTTTRTTWASSRSSSSARGRRATPRPSTPAAPRCAPSSSRACRPAACAAAS